MGYTPSPHVRAGAHGRSRAVQSFTWPQMWGHGRRQGHSHGIASSPDHASPLMAKRRVKYVLCFRYEGRSSSHCLVAQKDPILAFCVPKTPPIQLWITFLPARMDSNLSRPTSYYFGKVMPTVPIHTLTKVEEVGAIYSSREQEKQFSRSFQVSERENIPVFTGSNVKTCPGRPFLLLNLHFISTVLLFSLLV